MSSYELPATAAQPVAHAVIPARRSLSTRWISLLTLVALLALSDEGAPAYDRGLAARLAALGVPAFACTPDLFPDMMAAAIRKQDLNAWAAGAGIAAVPAAREG